MTHQVEHRFVYGCEHDSHGDKDVAVRKAERDADEELAFVTIPTGLSHLDASPRPQALPAKDVSHVEDASHEVRAIARSLVETLGGENAADRLVLRSGRAAGVRLNGRPTPFLAVLQVGDQLQVGDGPTLHVTTYRRPSLGPPEEKRLGKECFICRVPFDEKTRIFVCPNCDTALHCETEEHGAQGKRLECALMGPHCPFCGEPISLTEGYDHVPDL